VRRVAIVCITLLWASAAYPCSATRSSELEDRAEQRALTREFTLKAESIVLAKALRVDRSTSADDQAQFRITKVLKGPLTVGTLVTYSLHLSEVMGCTAASWFDSALADEGDELILYVRDGQLLRSGSLKRTWPEISGREEMRIVRKTLEGLDV
jgi:hypothetical protein